MRRSALIPLLTGLAIACPALLVWGGCAENNQSLYILGNGVPDASCEVKSGDTSTLRSSGVLDILVGWTYQLFPIVRNDMPSSLVMHKFEPKDGRLDAHNVFLKQAKLHYTYGSRALTISDRQDRTVPISGQITYESTNTISVTAIDYEMGKKLDSKMPLRDSFSPYPTDSMLIDLQIIAEMSDGSEIASNVFSYPLRVCRGCLLDFPGEADEDGLNPLDCNKTSSDVGVVPCNPGQDLQVDCRLCKRIRSQDPIAQAQCDPL